jgi:predicted transposase YbfD/YdcC
MDLPDSTTWLAHLQQVPDPRQRRGQSFAWWYLLALIAAALAGGCRTITASTAWMHEHKTELITSLNPAKKRMPSYATIRRVLVSINVEALEQQMAAYDQTLDRADATVGRLEGADGMTWRGQAVDGKTVRGASAHGHLVHLVSLVRHESGAVLDQCQVADKSNEITAVPTLLADRDLMGTVTTMDALLTQQSQARQILDQGGHYLMVVKENQATLYGDLALLFAQPQALRGEQDPLVWRQTSQGHGRKETRTVESSVALNDYVAWPGVGQVLRRTYHSVQRTTGKVTHEVTYGITSLSRQQASPEHIAWFWRQHWTIENRVHYVRDETMGEDRCQVHTGKAPRVLAALRNALLSLLRYRGWTNIAAALRSYGASPQKVLQLIGAPAT